MLRCAAVVCLVLAHVAAYGLWAVSPGGGTWYACNAYNSLCRMCIPVFVMVSGAMLLPRDAPMWRYVRRAVLTLLVWGTAYIVIITTPWMGGDGDYSPIAIALHMIQKPDHLWFLYMIGGLYLITPILRQIARDRRTTGYFLILWFAFCIILPTLSCAPKLHRFLPSLMANIGLEGIGLYSGYFILGQMLAGPAGDRYDRLGLSLFLAGVFMTFGLTMACQLLTGHYISSFNECSSLNVCISGVGGFLMFRRRFKYAQLPATLARAVNVVAVSTMGVYILHYPLTLVALRHGFRLLEGGWVPIPLFALTIGLTSLALALIIKRIPLLGKLF
ncbi:MAG: acyltransferase family protein [Candidatus Amulumruptor caecigallinarius]|nr:acyltransferase family protein [Candidatus Amulumruptor caecigallinarius]MCM1397578.1 acyltransferase family protein [Candidatus Amulumruptor caecigallinarius]MCM1453956.1 acyltransferase family protein [bacterium]